MPVTNAVHAAGCSNCECSRPDVWVNTAQRHSVEVPTHPWHLHVQGPWLQPLGTACSKLLVARPPPKLQGRGLLALDMPHIRHSGGVWQAHRPRRMLEGSLLVCRLQPQGLGCHGLLLSQAGRRQRSLMGLLLLLPLECIKLSLAAEQSGPSSPLRMPGGQLLPLCRMLCSVLAVHLPTQWGVDTTEEGRRP